MRDKVLALIKEDGLTIAILLALVIGYLALRTPADEFGSAEELRAQLVDGRPTVIEFYSNT